MNRDEQEEAYELKLTQSRMFFYPKEEIENFAAVLEALAQSLYAPRIRSGERFLETTMDTMTNMEALTRELVHEADTQERDEPLPGEMALDRDAIRFLCYGVIHVFRAFKDGKDETVNGETSNRCFAGIYSGFWWLVGRFEREDRQEVYDRLERLDRFERSLERQFGERSEADLVEVPVACRSLVSLEEPLISVIDGITTRPEANHSQLLRLMKDQGRRLLAFTEQAPRKPPTIQKGQLLVPAFRLRHLGELLRDGAERQSPMALQEAADLLRELLAPGSGR